MVLTKEGVATNHETRAVLTAKRLNYKTVTVLESGHFRTKK